ncbi:helix-turn-helix domain-containing protein [Campylobacter concisus]|uniref:helix-turn-helix domain-containing protein n=1 Tax=Campylobacter concisus TaxID=199 RepID=UPI000CD8B63A
MTPLLPITDPITTKQACELLKCNAVTLWRYVRDGKLKSMPSLAKMSSTPQARSWHFLKPQ